MESQQFQVMLCSPAYKLTIKFPNKRWGLWKLKPGQGARFMGPLLRNWWHICHLQGLSIVDTDDTDDWWDGGKRYNRYRTGIYNYLGSVVWIFVFLRFIFSVYAHFCRICQQTLVIQSNTSKLFNILINISIGSFSLSLS